MMGFFSKRLSFGKKGPQKNGHFLSFEDDDSSKKSTNISWEKCASWDALYMQDFSNSLQSKSKSQRKSGKMMTDSTADLSENHTLPVVATGDNGESSVDHRRRRPSQGTAIIRIEPRAPPSTKRSNTSNHIICGSHTLINLMREADSNQLLPLQRSHELDELARVHADEMAAQSKVFPSDPHHLCSKLKESHDGNCKRIGENAFKGVTPAKLHTKLAERASNYANACDPRYTEVGVAVVRDSHGVLYECQLFRG